jgi:isopenicillin-N N-acyltransferase-like protein
MTQPQPEFRLPIIYLRGTHYEMGAQLGEARREEVRAAVALVQQELGRVATIESAMSRAEEYVLAIEVVAPRYVEEIRGLAAGARISFNEALLLQLRFEAVGYDTGRGAVPQLAEGCSSFAYVQGGRRVTGQNVDIPPAHIRMGQLVHMEPPAGPRLLFYTYYAGLLGYLGINSEGLSVFGNALLSPGWRIGFPRYFMLRLALEQSTVDDVERLLRSVKRASTINLLVTDRHSAMADFELAVDDYARLPAHDGSIFHTNHYLAEKLRPGERLAEILPDSPLRWSAGSKLLAAPTDSSNDPLRRARALLKDHTNYPAAICRHAVEPPRAVADAWVTVASLIAQPDAGVLSVCPGNPCAGDYVSYELH